MEAEPIAFWATRFAEQMQLIVRAFQTYGVEGGAALDEALARLEHEWRQQASDPAASTDDMDELVTETVDVERQSQRLLEQRRIVCWPELIAEMMHELHEYFVPAILNDDMTPIQEAQFWCSEHAQNLEFNNCHIEFVLQTHGVVELPPDAQRLWAENEQLASRLEAMRAQLNPLRSSRVDRLPLNVQRSLRRLFQSYLKTMDQTRAVVRGLPLPENALSLLELVLHYQRDKAEFAEKRLQLA